MEEPSQGAAPPVTNGGSYLVQKLRRSVGAAYWPKDVCPVLHPEFSALRPVSCCAICNREETLTRHYLIPKARHPNKKNKRDFGRRAVKQTAGICRPCHSQIHLLLTEKQLEREWNSIQKLRMHEELRKFATWIATKPRGFRCSMRGGTRR